MSDLEGGFKITTGVTKNKEKEALVAWAWLQTQRHLNRVDARHSGREEKTRENRRWDWPTQTFILT